jgi:hypothetical protein
MAIGVSVTGLRNSRNYQAKGVIPQSFGLPDIGPTKTISFPALLAKEMLCGLPVLGKAKIARLVYAI